MAYHHQWRPGLEFAEVASTAMELLAEPYLGEDKGGFMSIKDAARTRLLNLEEKLLFWPYMAVVVAFQHWVYENHNEGKSPAACDAKWSALIDEYMPGIDWEGYEDVKMTGWHRKLHIHQVPFYYIEYGLASLGAFQIMEKARLDQTSALKDYRKALALGGTVTLPELYRASGANLSFDVQTMGEVVELIEENLTDLEVKISLMINLQYMERNWACHLSVPDNLPLRYNEILKQFQKKDDMAKKIKVVIPMAGYGKRLAAAYLEQAKTAAEPGGKTVIEHVLDTFNSLPEETEVEYVFIVGYLGDKIQDFMAEEHPDQTVHFVVQEEMRGQSHAIYLAKDYIEWSDDHGFCRHFDRN